MSLETITPYQDKQMPPVEPELTSHESDQQITRGEIEAIALQLQPRTELDDQNLTRTIFEHDGVTFAFKGREETPRYPTLQSSKPTYLGRRPIYQSFNATRPEFSEVAKATLRERGMSQQDIDSDERKDIDKWEQTNDSFDSYFEEIAKLHETATDQPEHLLVEQSAYGVYALLEELEPDNPHWQEQRHNLSENHYNQEALDLIDGIIAINRSVDRLDIAENPPLGEAVAVMAALGNEKATTLLQRATESLRAEEQLFKKQQSDSLDQHVQQLQELSPEQHEAYELGDLLAVHATRFEPEYVDGNYRVATTHDSTGYPRSTIHTALNHRVDSHMAGNWDSAGYVLIGPLDSMVEQNGAPANINGADTWWTRNPGETLDFPEATLIGPGDSREMSAPFVRDGSRVYYKTSDFTPKDLDWMIENLDAKEQLLANLPLLEDGSPDLSSEEAQKTLGSNLLSSLVFQEIVVERGKEFMRQTDDKYMDPMTNRRLLKLGANVLGGVYTSIHNGGSFSHEIENLAGEADPGYVGSHKAEDLKPMRVAYASGMVAAGGQAKNTFDQRKKSENGSW